MNSEPKLKAGDRAIVLPANYHFLEHNAICLVHKIYAPFEYANDYDEEVYVVTGKNKNGVIVSQNVRNPHIQPLPIPYNDPN